MNPGAVLTKRLDSSSSTLQLRKGVTAKFETRPVTQRNGANLVTIMIRQTQTGLPFSDSIPVTISSEGKTTRLTLAPKGKLATAQVRVGKAPLDIKIDPEDTILKEFVSGQTVR